MKLTIRPRSGPDCTIIRTKKALDVVVEALMASSRYALDTETDAGGEIKEVSTENMVGISLYTPKLGEPVFIPTGFQDNRRADIRLMEDGMYPRQLKMLRSILNTTQLDVGTVMDALDPVFKDKRKSIIGHNIKFDFHVLKGVGGIIKNKVRDTMIQSWLIDENDRVGLKARVEREFGYKMVEFKQLIGVGRNKEQLSYLSIPFVSAYAKEDALYSWRLDKLYTPMIDKIGLKEIFEDVLMPMVRILYRMEDRGIRIDIRHLDRLDIQLTNDALRMERDIYVAVGKEFNLNSRDQLAEILFTSKGKGGLGLKPIKRTGTGKASTDAAVLNELALQDKVCGDIVKYRGLTKLKGTYIDGLKRRLENGRIHTDFRMGNVVTGRLSSANPNLQNIPIRVAMGKEIRNLFIADPGESLIVCDLKNIELRLLAHFSGDAVMLEAFENGKDLHGITAAKLFGANYSDVDRGRAKNVNFGVIYGQGPVSLGEQLGVSKDVAKTYIQGMFDTYPAVGPWIQSVHQEAATNVYVKTLLGRYRRLPEILTPVPPGRSEESRRAWGLRARAQRQSVNSIIQGTAFDILALSMVNMTPKLPRGCKMLLQVHDELVFTCPDALVQKAKRIIEYHMNHPFGKYTDRWLTLPIETDTYIVKRWGEAK